MSIIYLQGVNFLHRSELKVHGNLKSKNCMVNSRWTIKLQDFGPKKLIASDNNQQQQRDQFQNAAEMNTTNTLHGNQNKHNIITSSLSNFSITIDTL